MSNPAQPVFRFAPSPNGYLHLGHAYSALFTAHWAQQMGGAWLLRIEDIDQARSRSEFVDAIFEDLKWLGLDWPEPVMVQSRRMHAYAAAFEKLKRMDLVYPCFCSRQDVRAKATRTDPDGASVYSGTCRNLEKSERARRLEEGEPAQWRLDAARARALAGVCTYSVAGPTPLDRPQIRYARLERWGDVVLLRKDTPTSYHLSVVVDDAAQSITHVTRGRDLEAATDVHAVLQFLLGLPGPLYTFHRLIEGDDGKKLSKSKGAPALRDLRAQGIAPEAVRAQLGFGEPPRSSG